MPSLFGSNLHFFLSPRSSTVLPTPRVTDEIFKATPFETYKGIIDREETYLEALGERFDLSTFYGNDWVLTSACRSHQILWKHLGSNFSLQIPSDCMETIGFQLQPSDPFKFSGNDWVPTSTFRSLQILCKPLGSKLNPQILFLWKRLGSNFNI